MWAGWGALAAATADGPAGNASLYIAGGLAALSTIAAAFLAMRGTFRTASTQREAAFDAQIDADRAQLRADNERLRAERDALIDKLYDCRERHTQLRIAVRERGLDPDSIAGGGGGTRP